MSNEQTFDLDNQPGIRKKPISRADYKRLAEVLGLDPFYVISMDVGNEGVAVTALLQSTDGNKVLGGADGYLKHTYKIPLEDKLCESGAFYYQEEGE